MPRDSLPALQDIEAWALDTMTSYPMHAAFGSLGSSFLEFARVYYESDKNLPLVSLYSGGESTTKRRHRRECCE